MISRTLKASQSLASVTQQHGLAARRAFTSATVRRADLVQDLYLRELRNYKIPQVKASDAEAHVQKFHPPKPPRSPEETDLASDLKAYESQQVEVEGQQASGKDTSASGKDWFEDEDEELDGDNAGSGHH